MLSRKTNGFSRSEYATRSDFEKIFTEDMAGLHLLALLLTGSEQAAEQCFVAGLDDSIHSNPVFKEWARSWAKRAIIKRAIRIAAPWPGEPAAELAPLDSQALDPQREALIRSVLRLPALERFVFVMSVLEGYSVPECSVLLGCTVRQIVEARLKSVKAISLGRGDQASAPPMLVAAWKSLFSSLRVA